MGEATKDSSRKRRREDPLKKGDGDEKQSKSDSIKKAFKKKSDKKDKDGDATEGDKKKKVFKKKSDKKDKDGDSTEGDKKKKSYSADKNKKYSSAKKKSKKDAEPVPQNHKEQKALKMKRKEEKNPNFEMIKTAKAVWEKARDRNTNDAERKQCVNEMMEAITGKIKDVIYQHDSTRLIQSCIKHGTREQRSIIFAELSDDILKLSKSKYGKFLIPKMLMYGTKAEKATVIESFYGKVAALVKHKLASPVVAVAYIDFATSEQKSNMLQEFYGPQFTVFKIAGKLKTLESIFESHPDKKPYILKNLQEQLTPLLEKGICAHHIVHRALNDLMSNLEPDSNEFKEMLETVKELLVEMVHSRDGAMVAARCIWFSDAKTRKVIVRSMKPFIEKICTNEYGYFVLLALFDSVDDTVFVNKQIISPMLEQLDEIAMDQYAMKVLLYLIKPRATKYLFPDVLKRLQIGDGNPFSKKETGSRQTELRNAALPGLIKFCISHVKEFAGAGIGSQFLHEVISAAVPDKCEADLTTLLEAVSDTIETGTSDPELKDASGIEKSLLMSGVGHRFAKSILKTPKREAEDKGVANQFALLAFDKIQGKVAKFAENNRASFVILSLIEGDFDSKIATGLTKELKPLFKGKKELTKGAIKIKEFMDKK